MSFPQFTGNQSVEAVIISLIFFNFDDSRFLEEIASHFGANNVFGFIEVHLHVFTEPTRVIVPGRFAVTKRFKNGIAT
jgi:hypothetical protein